MELTGKDIGITAVKGRLLKVNEVAKFMRVSPRYVRQHMADRTFPVRWYPVGERGRVVDSADLDSYLLKIKNEEGTASLPLKAKRKLKKLEVTGNK